MGAAGPIAASAAGSYISSRGSQKAASGARPQVPAVFNPAVGQAAGLLGNRLAGGFPPFAMPGSGDVLSSLQNASIGQAGNTLGAGNQGFADALRTMTNVSQMGIDPSVVRDLQNQLDPFFSYQRNQGMAQAREGAAQGGRFFGTGALTNENNFMNQFLANQAGTILPLAIQHQQLRLQGAQGVGQNLLANQAFNTGNFQLGGAEQQQRLQEFLRTQPEAAIPYLASLMQGTPMSYNPQGTNFLQSFGGGLNSMIGSPGFWQYMQSIGGGPERQGPPAPWHLGNNVGPG